MAKYIDGFVLVVPKNKAKEYTKMAKEGADIWMKHGALEYFECKGDDLAAQEMGDAKTLAFPKMAQAKASEDVWFSFIVYKSKDHRNRVNSKVMKEMEKMGEKHKNMPMPFDMKRMAYGGFSVEVEDNR